MRFKMLMQIILLVVILLALFYGISRSSEAGPVVDDRVYVISGEHEDQMGTVVFKKDGSLYLDSRDGCFVVKPEDVEILP